MDEKEMNEKHIRIIEFFRNDPIVIKDFLATSIDTPWDMPYMYKYRIDKEQLKLEKKNLLDDLITCYYDYLCELEFENKTGVSVTKSPEELEYLFFCDENYSIKIVKHFINYLNEVDSINICTHNYFKYDILNLFEIYRSETELMGLNNVDRNKSNFYDEFQKRYSVFSIDLFECIKHYLEARIDIEDESKFINYLFSLAYAYIKNSEDTGEKLDKNDKDFLELVKSDLDLDDYFFRYPVVSTFVVECIFDLYSEYKDNYDIRHMVNDDDSVELFNKLDDNYEDEFDDDILINNICLDMKLEQIMSFFKTKDLIPGVCVDEVLTNQAIIDILDDKYSLYEPLVTVGLDGRYEEEYKKLIIRKIVADCYEYLSYIVTLDDKADFIDSYDEVILDEIKKMDTEWKEIYSVFYTYGAELLDIWYRYNKEDINFHTKACINSKNKKVIIKVLDIYYYAIYRYTKTNNIKELKSVDMMNSLLDKIKYNSLDNSDSTMSNIMCLNVYERSLDSTDNNEFITLLSSQVDIDSYLKNNKDKYNQLVDMFKSLNRTKISYIEENRLRKNIKDKEHVKILKKLNPYDEEI